MRRHRHNPRRPDHRRYRCHSRHSTSTTPALHVASFLSRPLGAPALFLLLLFDLFLALPSFTRCRDKHVTMVKARSLEPKGQTELCDSAQLLDEVRPLALTARREAWPLHPSRCALSPQGGVPYIVARVSASSKRPAKADAKEPRAIGHSRRQLLAHAGQDGKQVT